MRNDGLIKMQNPLRLLSGIRHGIFISLAAISLDATQAENLSSRFKLAEGLEIHQIATDAEVPDCTCIAINDKDQIYAAGPNYLRMIQLDETDNEFASVTNVTQSIHQAAQGLYVDSGSVYYVADGGIWQIELNEDSTDSGQKRIKHIDLPTGSEHTSHAIRKGKDENWYLIVGNACDSMAALQNTKNPLIPEPRAGMIWKFSSDWKNRSIVAHGLRNAYDFDFTDDGNFVTYDSDGERDISLPWYRPTRVFLIKPGEDAGWVTRSWKRPNSDPSMPTVLAELGRGSPTGVKRSKGKRLPERFHNGTFVLDWTFGRIVFVSDKGRTELIAQPRDYSGFAVTDIETLKDGRLIVSVGGRGSSGGLYLIDRIRHQSNSPTERSVGIEETAKDQQTEINETRTANLIRPSKEKRLIKQIRDRPTPAIHIEAASLAISAIENQPTDIDSWHECLTLLIESVGGLGKGDPKDARGGTQSAAVFDGYRGPIRPKLSDKLRDRASKAILAAIPNYRGETNLHDEMIRTIAVLEPEESYALKGLLTEMQEATNPIRKLHCLLAIARLPCKRSDDQTEVIVDAMLDIVRGVRSKKMNTDRHWPIRLGELFDALQYRDSLLPSRIVAHPDFGEPADLIWMERMDPENLERARQKLLAQEPFRNNPEIATFIARGDDVVPRPITRQWLSQVETREAGIIALTNDARITDEIILRREAWSSNAEIQKLVRSALKRLDLEIPPRPNESESVSAWDERLEVISTITGEQNVGAKIYEKKLCAKCHDGNRTLGPRLEGVGKRFNRETLLKSIYDPSDTISDRYRSRIIISKEDERIEGIPIYESVDGITLLTADGKTLRIENDKIQSMKPSSISTMPEGLLDGLSDQEVASLIEYLQSL